MIRKKYKRWMLDWENRLAFRATNRVVLGEGIRIAQENREGLLALVAWNGISRGDSDTTDAFLREARALGMTASEVSTL